MRISWLTLFVILLTVAFISGPYQTLRITANSLSRFARRMGEVEDTSGSPSLRRTTTVL